ncbi:MAG: nitroreductase [Firmicutes bacterium]|nr:nitroreductase [Bacillota bacterium]
MDVREAIERRRAYRSLSPVKITPELLADLALAASLAPSCFNKQPWRFVAVYDREILSRLHGALARGNEWARDASMLIAVCSRKDLDCVLGQREYFLFDTGMAVAFLQLRATELDLVAHPFAGFKPKAVAEILNIPEDMTVIALVAVGKRSPELSPRLSEHQVRDEKVRPERLAPEKFFFHNRYPDGV